MAIRANRSLSRRAAPLTRDGASGGPPPGDPKRDAFAGGTDVLIAGAAGGLFAPLARFGLELPWWVAVPGALVVFLGIRLLIAPRALFQGMSFSADDQASLELAREVILGAQEQLARLTTATQRIRKLTVQRRLEHLIQVATKVLRDLERRPSRVNAVRRLLTYYLPATVTMADGYRVLELQQRPDPERVRSAEETIEKLDGVFATYADRLVQEDVAGLEVEMKLLDDAIREERSV